MARPSGLGKPPQKTHRRLTLLLDGEDSTKERISKEEFKEMIKTDPNRVFTMVETLINECEDTIEELNNVITTQEERLAEQTLGIEAVQARYDALSNQINELTAAKNTAEDEREAFALRLARNTGPLVSVATSRKSAKIPDLPLLDNGQDPLFKD
jgi:chromosome segregation ATPase